MCRTRHGCGMRALPATTDVTPFEGAELIETHTSRVFLTPTRAYKVKKPVSFPFLDYATLDSRRHQCHEEVRLNRRLAPHVYLGVRSLVRRPDGDLVLADADAVDAEEYVVEMRRIPQGMTLAERITSGSLDATDIRAVAARLADFHATAESVDKAGAPDLKRRLDACFEEMLELPFAIPQIAGLEAVLSARLRDLASQLDERACKGLVRDVHGDLRAEHVVLSDPIEVFDCIEFDPQLRQIDVGCDLAFLVMDLERMGAPDQARALVSDYRAAGGDPGSDQLVALFAAYRALVRAKVAFLRARQIDGMPRARELDAAGSLLALARRFAWRSAFPLAVVICGGAASGKTTLAALLADLSGLTRLSSDVTRKGLAGLPATERAPEAAYTDEWSRRTYERMGSLATDEVRSTGGVVVDATFRNAADRAAFASTYSAEAEPVFVECVAPATVIAARALERCGQGRESDADAPIALRQLAAFEPLDEVPARCHFLFRTDRPPDELAAAVERTLLVGSSPGAAQHPNPDAEWRTGAGG